MNNKRVLELCCQRIAFVVVCIYVFFVVTSKGKDIEPNNNKQYKNNAVLPSNTVLIFVMDGSFNKGDVTRPFNLRTAHGFKVNTFGKNLTLGQILTSF